MSGILLVSLLRGSAVVLKKKQPLFYSMRATIFIKNTETNEFKFVSSVAAAALYTGISLNTLQTYFSREKKDFVSMDNFEIYKGMSYSKSELEEHDKIKINK
ncbi:hypothetical protein [Flammeovirga pacifica]|nr:hypothetical protein [Flammeovirga pacifica]